MYILHIFQQKVAQRKALKRLSSVGSYPSRSEFAYIYLWTMRDSQEACLVSASCEHLSDNL